MKSREPIRKSILMILKTNNKMARFLGIEKKLGIVLLGCPGSIYLFYEQKETSVFFNRNTEQGITR